MGIFSKLEKAFRKPAIEIPYGDFAIDVYGLTWCKIPLVDSDDCLFSLTELNEYQKMQGWPEEGCVNVNAFGSTETTVTNWAGYIRSSDSEKLLGVVKEHQAVNAHASVRVAINKLGNYELTVTLHIPLSLAPRKATLLRFSISEKYWIGTEIRRTRRFHDANIVMLEPETRSRKPHIGIVDTNGKVIFEVQARVTGYRSLEEMCGKTAKTIFVQRKKSNYDKGYYYHVEFDFMFPNDSWEI